MKREEKKSFGLVGTQIELTNAEMDTLVRLQIRTNGVLESMTKPEAKTEYFVQCDYQMLEVVLKVLIGDYVNNTTNAFEEAFLKIDKDGND
jgi:hypothetical protein